MKNKLFISLLMFLCFNILKAELVNISKITELLSVESLGLQGTIKNIKMAPFNKDLISFELWDENNEGASLYLYNRSNSKVLKIESAQILNSKKKVRRPKDYNVYWHPDENWFVFNGNAGNNTNIYICRIADNALNNKFAVKGSVVNFKEKLDDDGKKPKAVYSEPAFSSDGQTIVFVRKLALKGETAVLCRSTDFESAKEKKFDELSFEIIAKKEFDISNPLPSPKAGSNLIAFCANQNKISKKNKDPYLNYSINVINSDSKEEVEVNSCDGFSVYSHFWNNSGEYLYYYKALPREKTSQEDLNDKSNVLNLYATKIIQSGSKVISIPQSNQKTDVILENVSDRGFIAIDDANLLVPMYSEGLYSIVAVNLDLWRNKEKSYHEIVELKYPAYYPQYLNNELFYVNYKTTSDENFIDMISSAQIKLSFPSGSKTPPPPIATAKPAVKKSRTDENTVSLNADKNKTTNNQSVIPIQPAAKLPETAVVPPIQPATTKTALKTPSTDLLPLVTGVLQTNRQLTLQEIFAKLNIPIDDKAAIAQISQILRENADITTSGTKRFFSLKKSDLTNQTAENTDSDTELQKVDKELQFLKDRNKQITADLETSTKEKAVLVKSEAEYLDEKNKKQSEIKSLELTTANIREAGSNQLAILSAQKQGLDTELQNNSLELTRTYDEITAARNELKNFESILGSSKQSLPKLVAAIENLKKDKQTAQDNALAAEQKAMEEEAAKNRLETEAKAKIEADKIAKVKAEEAIQTAKKDSLEDEYAEEVEDEYTEETDEDETAVETPVVTPKAQPASIKKRR